MGKFQTIYHQIHEKVVPLGSKFMQAIMKLNLDALNTAITSINDALWAYLLIGALILCGLYFTIRTRFVQFTMIGDMFRQLSLIHI